MIDYLVIDDDETFRDRLVRALTRRGLSVASAARGDEALALLERQSVARITLDLKMPGQPGLELIPDLMKHGKQPKIVVLTGYGSIATTQAAIKAGAFAYLTKPCDIERILLAFEDPLSNQEKRSAPTPSLAQVEWEHIQRILSDCQGNVTHAAKVLGLDRRSLQRRLAKSPPLC